MPSITTIATSPIPGRGLNRGPRTNVPSAPPPAAPQLFFRNPWAAAGKPEEPGSLDVDYTWNNFNNWWMDSACTVKSADLPTTDTVITLISDCSATFINDGSPIPHFDASDSFIFASLNLNGHNLDLVAHNTEIDASWMTATQEERDSGAVTQYSCAPAVSISSAGINNNGAPPLPGQVRLFGHIELTA